MSKQGTVGRRKRVTLSKQGTVGRRKRVTLSKQGTAGKRKRVTLSKEGTVGRRKCVTLAVPQRLETARRLESGESQKVIMALYNIGLSTVCDIKKRQDWL